MNDEDGLENNKEKQGRPFPKGGRAEIQRLAVGVMNTVKVGGRNERELYK
jgi:hypothetical protein